jgi:L-iditol 2-dehydrogenase
MIKHILLNDLTIQQKVYLFKWDIDTHKKLNKGILRNKYMKAAVLYKANDLRLEDINNPKIRSDQVLVRVRSVGICGSDIHYYEKGRIGSFVVKEPLILGHECAGEISKVGDDVKNFKIGDRVAIEPGFACGKCLYCRKGMYNLCDNMRFYATPPVNGAFCEYVAADAGFVYKIPDSMTFEEGSLIEPLSVGIHAARLGKVSIGKTVAILGAGPVGLCILQAVIVGGASQVIMTDIRDHLLRCAKQLGAAEAINVKSIEPMKKILELTDGRGVDIAVEAVGSVATIRQALSIASRGGTIVLVGLLLEDECPIKTSDVLSKELTIRGLFRYVNTYPTAIKLVSSGRINLKSLITHTLKLEEIHKGFKIASEKSDNAIKVVIKI